MACSGRSAVLAAARSCGPRRRRVGIFPDCSALRQRAEIGKKARLAMSFHILNLVNERRPLGAGRQNSTSERNAPGVVPLAWLLGVVTFSLAAVATMMAWTGMTVESPLWLGLLIGAAAGAFSAIGLRFRVPRSEGQRIWRDAAEYFGVFTSLCLVGALAPYPLVAMSSGFADVPLERIDQMLGFDWLAWYRFVVDYPAIQWFDRAAYESIFVSPAALLLYFAWTGRKAEARLFILSFWAAATITLVLYAYMPAKGPLALLWRGPLPYVPASALYQAELIPGLRSHALHRINLSELQGLVSAPSFHAASALLFIWAAWPIRPLKWPITILNIAMLLATPVEGTHYLIDIIAGAGVALVAVAVIRTVAHHFTRRSSGSELG